MPVTPEKDASYFDVIIVGAGISGIGTAWHLQDKLPSKSYAILEAQSKAEAIDLTRRFLKVHGTDWDVECEVRQLDGPEFGCKP